MSESESAGVPESKKRGVITVALVLGALVLILLVAGFGWYQFRHRADAMIEVVKSHAIRGTDMNIAEGILDFVEDSGYKVVTDGFKPSWGAEEVSDGVWVVSYVFEVGRRARWISWKVDQGTGEVVPRDRLARELWEGD